MFVCPTVGTNSAVTTGAAAPAESARPAGPVSPEDAFSHRPPAATGPARRCLVKTAPPVLRTAHVPALMSALTTPAAHPRHVMTWAWNAVQVT